MQIKKFYADWCSPCKQLTPVLDAVAKERGLEVEHINIETDADQVEKYGVMSVPTVLFVKDGEVVGKFSGALPAPAVAAAVDKALNAN